MGGCAPGNATGCAQGLQERMRHLSSGRKLNRNSSSRGDLHSRRLIARDIQDREVQRKLMDEIGPRYATRPGGYTRIYRLDTRRGDAVQEPFIELVNGED